MNENLKTQLKQFKLMFIFAYRFNKIKNVYFVGTKKNNLILYAPNYFVITATSKHDYIIYQFRGSSQSHKSHN